MRYYFCVVLFLSLSLSSYSDSIQDQINNAFSSYLDEDYQRTANLLEKIPENDLSVSQLAVVTRLSNLCKNHVFSEEYQKLVLAKLEEGSKLLKKDGDLVAAQKILDEINDAKLSEDVLRAKEVLQIEVLLKHEDPGLLVQKVDQWVSSPGDKLPKFFGINKALRRIYEFQHLRYVQNVLNKVYQAGGDNRLESMNQIYWINRVIRNSENPEHLDKVIEIYLSREIPPQKNWQDLKALLQALPEPIESEYDLELHLNTVRGLGKFQNAAVNKRINQKLAALDPLSPLVFQNVSLARDLLWKRIRFGDLEGADKMVVELIDRGWAEGPYAHVITHYNRGEYQEAVAKADEFLTSLSEGPKGLRAHGENYLHALVYKWRSQRKLNEQVGATDTARRIVEGYPDTAWAENAQQWLSQATN